MISIILPTYNRADRLGRAIRSVLDQTYRAWELLVVDDASTDETAAIVSRFADRRIFYMRLPFNCGSPARPRNVGLQVARGDYFAYIDDDNSWRPQHLERLLAATLDHPGAAGAYGGKAHHLPNGQIEEICYPGQGIDTQDGLHTRAALSVVPEGWVGNSFTHEDAEFWGKIHSRHSQGLVWVPEILSDYYIHDEQRYYAGFQNTRMYDRDYYVRNPSRLAEATTRRQLVDLILDQEPANVLDVGCGEGWLVRELRAKGLFAWGIDPTTILAAITQAPGCCVQARADALPCQEQSVDLVVCVDVLQHIPEPRLERTLRELGRVGRRFLFAVDCENPQREGHRTLRGPAWWHARCAEAGMVVNPRPLKPLAGLVILTASRGQPVKQPE